MAKKHEDSAQVVVTPASVVFSLTPEHREKAQQCLDNSGQVRISFSEVSVTNLTEIRELGGDGVIVD
ncbi:ApyA family aminopyruvatide-related RiPP [Streptomyces roseoverticillatus]|uniref:Uncharacterized protein n=1 Tax=Streptomyces roseoverticillatus TaxID=66429 RepID=A0ABV3IMA1_9ACTN